MPQTWSVVGTLPAARAFFSTTLLPNGKALLIGGEDSSHNNTNTSYLFDPTLNTWSTTGTLTFGRTDSVSILMTNGKVLTVSGETKGFAGANLSAEVYNPSTGLWTTVASPNQGHCQGAIWNLPSGKVLVASGFVDTFTTNNTTTTAEVYDPVGNTWTIVNAMPYHGANLQFCSLGDGRALVAGSFDPIQGVQKASAVYDESTGLWTSYSGYGGALGGYTSFNNMTAIKMASGDGLVIGGQDSTTVYAHNYKFNKTTNTWGTIADLPQAVAGSKTYLQSDGTIIATSGYLNSGLNSFTYKYDPNTDTWSTQGSLTTPRSSGGNTVSWPILNDGRCIIAGGEDVGGGTLNSTEVLSAIGGSMGTLFQIDGTTGDVEAPLIQGLTDNLILEPKQSSSGSVLIKDETGATVITVRTGVATLASTSTTGNLTVTNPNAVVFKDTGSNTASVEAPTTITSSYTLKLPVAQSTGSQVLTNDGSGNLSWSNSPTTPVTVANGGTGLTTLTSHDVLVGNGTSNITLISPSTAGFVLTSNGTGADPSFQAASGGGSTPNSNQTVSTSAFSSTSSTPAATGLSTTITPSTNTAKIKITCTITVQTSTPGSSGVLATLFRNSTNLAPGVSGLSAGFVFEQTGNDNSASISYIDSPATTSSITYAVGLFNQDNATAVYIDRNNTAGIITVEEVH